MTVIPSLEKQSAIKAFLATHQRYLTAKERYVENLRAQKIGLMSDLLTGHIRVDTAKVELRKVIK